MRTSLLDFPGRIATVVFTGGCNFRCPMCHNAALVLRPADLPAIPEEALWAFLARRAGLIDGLVVTGGEPTLSDALPAFLRRARAFDVALKLDTNGYRPEVLEALLHEGLVDFVALDLKAPPDKVALLAGRADLDVARVGRSLALLRESGVAYELRTTVVPGLLTDADVLALARWIGGADRWMLQRFRPEDALDPQMRSRAPQSPEALRALAEAARAWAPNVGVRG